MSHITTKITKRSGVAGSGAARSGFTLAELLLVIAIIAIMSTLGLSMMLKAQDTARESATQSRIRQIEAILQIQMEEYEVRQLPISTSALKRFVEVNPLAGVPVRVQVKNLRRRILADIIVAELAPPWLNAMNVFANSPDLGVFPTTLSPADAVAPFNSGFDQWLMDYYPVAIPLSGGGEISLRDRLALLQLGEVNHWGQFSGNADFDLPGEYLFEILLRTDFDGVTGVETLGNAAVGDTDGDGFPEIVDSWGESMQLRILQVGIDPGASTPTDDLWVDLPTDWTMRNLPPNPLPLGYQVINPTIPRPLRKIRFQVVSPHLDAY